MNINKPIKILYQKIKNSFLNPPVVFEQEVMEIQMSNEKKETKYNFKNFRKKFFTISIKTKDDVFKYLFYLSMLVFAFLMCLMSLETGVSEKEIQNQHNAELIYNYYATGDTAALQKPFLSTHTQIIDFLCCCAGKWFQIDAIYHLRHLVNAVFGWLTIFLLGLFLMDLFSWRAAFFGAFFLFISPHYLGQSFYNLADIPFAFFYLLAVFQIYLFSKELPIVKWRRVVYITLTILAATAIHIGGLVLLHYLLLFGFLAFILQNPIKKLFTKKYFFNLLKLMGILLAIVAVVYLVNIAYPLHSFRLANVGARQSIIKMFDNQEIISFLWGGEIISSEKLTVGFVLKKLQITLPLIIIIGIIIHFMFIKTILRTIHIFPILLIIYVLIFPLWKLSGLTLNLSDGWSLYLMIYPIIILYSVAGFEGILRRIDDRYTNVIIVGAICLLSFMPLRHTLLHPRYVNIYFNEISGGIHSNFGRFTLDPGEQSNNRASKWLTKYLHNTEEYRCDTLPKIEVLTDGSAGCDYFFRNDTNRIHLVHADFNMRDSLCWDYFITFADNVPPPYLRSGAWEKEDAIHRFFVERQQIAAIIKNIPDTLAVESPEILTDNKIK